MANMAAARWSTPAARRVLIACVLGSGIAFLDGTVVNVALPSIGTDLGTGLAGLQWVLNGYLLTLTALVLLGGWLGDRYGRRRAFLTGLAGFSAASLACGVAPTIETLVAARCLQGAAAALLIPGSLALLTSSIHPDDRSTAVGAWSGLTGVASALGPLVGGWLVDAASWRWVFLLNLPLAAVVVVVARRIPESGAMSAMPGPDVPGAAAAAAGLALVTAGLVGRGSGWSVVAVGAGVAILALFVAVERRSSHPMVPPSLFSSTQFSGANAVTFAVYAALAVAMFLVVVNLQVGLGYTALQAGGALLPITVLMLLLSAWAGAAAQRIGPRVPMTLGPLVMAAGLAWLSLLRPGDEYLTSVLPSVTVLGLGLAITVAPLTAVVLASVGEGQLGVASGVNNAVARLAGLLAVAAVPAIAGVELEVAAGEGIPGFQVSMLAASGLCVAGGLIAAATIRRTEPTRPTVPASALQPCHDPYRLARPQPRR